MDILVEEFIKHHPQHVAHFLESMPIEELHAFAVDAEAKFNEVVARLSPTVLGKLIDRSTASQTAAIVQKLPDLQAAMLLIHLSEQKQSEVVSQLPAIRKDTIERYMQFDNKQVGFYALKPKVVVTDTAKITEVLSACDHISKQDLPIWVVNSKHQLLGQIDFIKLVAKRHETHETAQALIDKDVVLVSGLTNLENVHEILARAMDRKVAVVGKSRVLVGTISALSLKAKAAPGATGYSRSGVEEYLYFSEMMWSGLNKFWTSIK